MDGGARFQTDRRGSHVVSHFVAGKNEDTSESHHTGIA